VLKTLFGYNGDPSLTEVIAYGLYYPVLFFGLRNQTKKLNITTTA